MNAVTTSNFDTEILASSGVAAVFFHAPWCKACDEMGAIVQALEGELSDITFASVNTDLCEEIVTQQGIHTIPTVRIFKDGKPAGTLRGVLDEAEFRNQVAAAANLAAA